MRYRPTCPLEFARPLGNWLLLELSRMRAVSQQLAASTTILALTVTSLRVFLSI
jgi:hypothetical protein